MKKVKLLIIIFIIFSACNSLKEAGKIIRNEKITSTDEFLVKKKQPLIYPPYFNELPNPRTSIKKKTEEDEIKKILKAPKDEEQKINSTSTEKSILKNIRK